MNEKLTSPLELQSNSMKGNAVYGKETESSGTMKSNKCLDFNVDQPINTYEYVKNNYEYIMEEQESLQLLPGSPGSPRFPNDGRIPNECSAGSSDDPVHNNNMFRKRTNPLYINSYDHLLLSKKPVASGHHPFSIGLLATVSFLSLLSSAVAFVALYKLSSHDERNVSLGETNYGVDVEEYFNRVLENVSTEIQIMKRERENLEVKLFELKSNLLDKMSKIEGIPGSPGAVNWSGCHYGKKESGSSASTPNTLTVWVPSEEQLRSWVVTGVTCAVEGDSLATLKSRTDLESKTTRFLCECRKGPFELDGRRYCSIYYWLCPKMS